MRHETSLAGCAAAVVMAAMLITHPARAGGSSTLPPVITAYWDASGSTQNVIYLDEYGELQDLYYNGSEWQTKEILGYQNSGNGMYLPPSPILAYEDNDGNGRVFFATEATNSSGYLDVGELDGTPPNTTSFHDISSLSGSGYHLNYGASPDFYENYNGDYIDAYVGYNGGIVGFQDQYSTPTHHVFYEDYSGYLRELYSSNSGDSDWYDHYIYDSAKVSATQMSALWDGSNEHVFLGASGGGTLTDVKYNGSSWGATSLTQNPGPWLGLSSFRYCTGCSWLQGSYYYDDSYTNGYAAVLYNSGSGWTADYTLFDTTNLDGGYTEVGLSWTDDTDNEWFSPGIDGGFFYIGSNSHLYLFIAGRNGSVDLTGSGGELAAGNPANQVVAGLWDGTTLHGYYVGQNGYIYEAYAAGSSITSSSSGSWTLHYIGGSGQAANYNP